MSEIIIGSYFFRDGVPAEGLSPTIRIWELSSAGQSLVVGAIGSTGSDGSMKEVTDGGVSDGLYQFIFDTDTGYDPAKSYAFRVDGGASQPKGERYQVGELNTVDNADAMVDLIYDENISEHTLIGTFGNIFGQINATTTQLFLDVNDISELMKLNVKYSANRTKFLKDTKQLVIYDDDCETPLRVFNMYDAEGNPSLTEMCERVPTSASDGRAICV